MPTRWGLVPPGMTRADADRLALFNTRLESAPGKPAFRQAWREGRALLPVRGWIEWRPALDGGRKPPYLVTRRDGKPVVLAVLSTPHEGTPTFAVLTHESAPSLAWLHSRMPLALPSADWDAWLSGSLTRPSPLPARVYEVTPLDPVINDARLDHPGMVQVTGPALQAA